MNIKHFYDQSTGTLTYLVYDLDSKDAVIIDPVWDFDPISWTLSSKSAQSYFDFIDQNQLKLHFILETHAHADHVSASQLLKSKYTKANVAICQYIVDVQKTFLKYYNLPEGFFSKDHFDVLLEPESTCFAGTFKFKVISTPGHTPACASFYFNEQAIFTGDTLFMPDLGTGRCDFEGASAKKMYESVTKNIYTLPPSTKIYVGHDYQPNQRELLFQSTVEQQKKHNIHINESSQLDAFVKLRTSRDQNLSLPKLIHQSLLINLRGGHLLPKESNEKMYFKIPLSVVDRVYS